MDLTTKKCSIEGCDKERGNSKHYCHMHYMRQYFGRDMEAAPQFRTYGLVDGKRTCTKCFRDLDIEQFYKNANGFMGRMAHCKECERASARERRQRANYKEAKRSYSRRYASKRRAMLRGATIGDVSFEAIRREQGDHCSYCNIEMYFGPEQYRDDKASMDHVIPLSRGGHHSNDNIVLACLACNMSKGNRLVSEWERSWA